MAAAIPTLQTDRLLLRPFDVRDVDPMTQILSEPDVLRYWPPGPPVERELVARMVSRLVAHWREHGFGLWAVERREDTRLLGRCGLQVIPDTGETEVDYILGKPYWGIGYATEAARRSLEFGFGEAALAEIVGIVHPGNVASRRVLEKLGMHLAAETRYFGMDVCRYVIRAPEVTIS